MRKTNSKEVKAAVRKYISECIEEGLTTKDVYDNFKRTYFATENQKKYFSNNERTAFKHWLTTIPGSFNIEFVTFEIVNIVGSWLDQTEKELEKYYEEPTKTEELFRELITKHFFEMIKE